MGIISIFSKTKIVQNKHFTKFIKAFRLQKSSIKFIKTLYHKKAASVLLQYQYMNSVRTVHFIRCYITHLLF